MADYKKIAEEALRKANELKGKKPKTLNGQLLLIYHIQKMKLKS